MHSPNAQLQERAVSLAGAARRHKDAIRRHREQLGIVTAELRTLEAECRARGIQLVIAPSQGEGVNHGHIRSR